LVEAGHWVPGPDLPCFYELHCYQDKDARLIAFGDRGIVLVRVSPAGEIVGGLANIGISCSE
jgi:hypothetical protein